MTDRPDIAALRELAEHAKTASIRSRAVAESRRVINVMRGPLDLIDALANALPALLDEVERLGADNEALGFVRESCATAMTDRDVARVQLDAARTNLAVVEALHLPLQANENVRRNCITDGMQWPCATYKAATKPGGTA